MSAFEALRPSFSLRGYIRIPKPYRALKGLRRVAPLKSPTGHAQQVVAALACRLMACRLPRMTWVMFLAFGAHGRPKAALRICKRGGWKSLSRFCRYKTASRLGQNSTVCA